MIKSTHIYVDKSIIQQALDSSFITQEVNVLNQRTGNFFYDPWEIKPELKNTPWEKLLDSLPFDKGEARVIILKPGESYMAHADIDDRWHLNLAGEYSYLVDLDSKIMYETKQDGCWYDMDTSPMHVASNYGSFNRVQLVVRQLLTPSKHDEMVNITIQPAFEQHDYRFKFDRQISPWLNINSKRGFISNFSFSGQTVSFKLYKAAVEDFNSILNESFKVDYA